MKPFQDRIRAALAAATGLAEADVLLEKPRDAAHGDLAFPCFRLAKERREPPPKIATDLAARLSSELGDVRAVATGPFLNFTIDRPALARWLFDAILDGERPFGSSDEGRGKTVLVDLSSPNIAKPMHVGHLRSTIIGAAIQRLHALLGYRTVGINHIGDWGSQFGKLVVALRHWGDTVDLEGDPIRALLAVYVRYHDEEEGRPELAEEARAAFRELESGVDGEVRATWKKITELSLREFDKVYRRLGVEFDLVRGEAFYEPFLDETVDRIVSAGITEESDGALIVRLDEIQKNMAPCLLRKTDGTTLYATRDLAAAFHRWEEFQFERALYVVGSDQKLHFRQFIGVLTRMQLEWAERMEHVAFGMMRLPEGKLQTRKGRVVFLDDVLDRAVDEARRIIEEKNPALDGLGDVAEMVGVGAVIFNDLKRERVKDVEFDWQEVVSFEGDTGPYVQYAHARLASILRKVEEAGEGPIDVSDPDFDSLEDAAGVLVRLARYPDVVASAARRAEPSEVTNWLLDLTREISSWYDQGRRDPSKRVLGQEPAVTAARVQLTRSCKCVLQNALELLGLRAPDEM